MIFFFSLCQTLIKIYHNPVAYVAKRPRAKWILQLTGLNNLIRKRLKFKATIM